MKKAFTEIQFPTMFFHIRRGKNVIRFVDIKSDSLIKRGKKEENHPPSREGVITNGIFKNIEAVITKINSCCEKAGSHVLLLMSGNKIDFFISCENDYEMIHYVNFLDNFLRILGIGYAITNPDFSFFEKLTVFKPNSEKKRIIYSFFLKMDISSKKTINGT